MLSSTKKKRVDVLLEKASGRMSRAGYDGLLALDSQLENLLGLDGQCKVKDILRDALVEPLREMASNPGKEIRGRLVSLAFGLLAPEAAPCAAWRLQVGAGVLELVHAGSLIVDDIEDKSPVRRGRPAMHVRYGLPIALNAGNWLYFWPLQLVKKLELPSHTTLIAYERYHQTLLKAHFGQAIDLGTQVDSLPQSRVIEVCLASVRLKTGALMGFGMVLGGLIAGAREATTELLDQFGSDLGVALQMFDDLGNIMGNREPLKRYEDLMLRRPSWVWAWAAASTSLEEYTGFVDAAKKLPDRSPIETWLSRHDLLTAGRASAQHQLEQAFITLERGLRAQDLKWSNAAFEELRALGEQIAIAYS
jgi:geranylgeranyl pyrophosphate synthase